MVVISSVGRNLLRNDMSAWCRALLSFSKKRTILGPVPRSPSSVQGMLEWDAATGAAMSDILSF